MRVLEVELDGGVLVHELQLAEAARHALDHLPVLTKLRPAQQCSQLLARFYG